MEKIEELQWVKELGQEIVEIKETPLVVINLDRISIALRRIQSILDEIGINHSIFYALKANYLQPILETLKNERIDGIEIISPLEKEIALKAGFTKDKMIYNGLFRDKKNLLEIIKGGGIVNIDSIDELKSLIGEDDISIGLRIHPEFDGDGNFVSRGSKLGMDQKSFYKCLEICKKNNIILRGLSFHIFSNLTNSKDARRAIAGAIKIIRDTEKCLDYQIEFLDIGGGLAPLILFNEDIGDVLKEILSNVKNTNPKLKIILELGRYLVSDAMCIISEIKGIKVNKGNRWAVLDIGTNYLIPAPGAKFKVMPINKITERPKSISFVDAICSPAGVIEEDNNVGNFEKGDRVAVCNCGAYTTVMKEQFVFGDPKHIFLKNGKEVASIEKMGITDILKYHGWENEK